MVKRKSFTHARFSSIRTAKKWAGCCVSGFPLDWFLGSMFGRIPSGPGPYDYHRTTYDAQSLTTVLTESGFVSIEEWDWRETEHAHVDDFSQAYFPHLEKDRGVLWNLNIQARKPA
jgi:hypothetical protein